MLLLQISSRKAEWLGNANRKTMIKVKTIGQMLSSKNGTALPSPSPAPGSAITSRDFVLVSAEYGK
jgi:hypothetical protein